jgi:hypothetical protein
MNGNDCLTYMNRSHLSFEEAGVIGSTAAGVIPDKASDLYVFHLSVPTMD